jgi:hypothetical protein
MGGKVSFSFCPVYGAMLLTILEQSVYGDPWPPGRLLFIVWVKYSDYGKNICIDSFRGYF